MTTLPAKPGLLKQANLSIIRRALKNKKTATRAELSEETGISPTTTRALLTEMMGNGEIESAGFDASSGGRKAERYRFQMDKYCGAAFCITDEEVRFLLTNLYGEVTDTAILQIQNDNIEQTIISFLDRLILTKEIKSIGIGVQGVVDGTFFWKKRLHDDELYRVDIGSNLMKRYGIPVILENDLNATAIGFKLCYEKEFPCEKPDQINMAYIHFEKGCISAGFIAEGRIIRGSRNFAGELGLIPVEGGRLLEESLSSCSDDAQYTDRLVKILSWVCGILNPQYIALGGSDLRKSRISSACDGLSAYLPDHMAAELLYSPDVWNDYFHGLAFLTSEKMFDEIQFVKE